MAAGLKWFTKSHFAKVHSLSLSLHVHYLQRHFYNMLHCVVSCAAENKKWKVKREKTVVSEVIKLRAGNP